MKTIDQRINALKHGQSIEISRCNGIVCTVERSGDGKLVRFVRHNGGKSEVYKTSKW
jgi:hypothetical protein